MFIVSRRRPPTTNTCRLGPLEGNIIGTSIQLWLIWLSNPNQNHCVMERYRMWKRLPDVEWIAIPHSRRYKESHLLLSYWYCLPPTYFSGYRLQNDMLWLNSSVIENAGSGKGIGCAMHDLVYCLLLTVFSARIRVVSDIFACVLVNVPLLSHALFKSGSALHLYRF